MKRRSRKISLQEYLPDPIAVWGIRSELEKQVALEDMVMWARSEEERIAEERLRVVKKAPEWNFAPLHILKMSIRKIAL